MIRVRTDRRTVLKILTASGGLPWFVPTVARIGCAQDRPVEAGVPMETGGSGESDGTADVPLLPLFSCVEPSLGDLWGRAAVISDIVVVPGGDPDTVTLLTCGDDHWLRMWQLSLTVPVAVPDVATEVERVPGRTPPVPGHEPMWVRRGGKEAHEDWVHALAISGDGSLAISGDAKGRILLWRFNDRGVPDETPQILQGRGPAILSAVRCPGTGDFVLAGENGTVRRYRATGPDSQSFAGTIGTLRSVDASPDGNYIAVGGDRGEIVVYSTRTGAVTARLATIGRRIRCVRFSPDGRRLVAAGDAGILYLCGFDPTDGTIPERGAFPRQVGRIYSLVWLGDRYVATGASDGRIRILQVDTRNVIMRSDAAGHTGTITSMRWLADTATLISGGYDTTIRLWRPSLPG
ncbi:MAG: hypothetical protein Q4C47_06320 [Planctomycetia bacterium]|nr:hypothetical protein [Planctomycetia bacterium]